MACWKHVTPSRLFVYGTLAPGMANHGMLQKMAGTWRRGSVSGLLHPAGTESTAGYPVVDLATTGTSVTGFLFTSSDLARHWDELDAFEGEGYRRVETRVTLADGSVTDAFIYALDHAADSSVQAVPADRGEGS
jgi:gamma-glutamylcyclotransferase (GGCT)/AIG2-like uncharacterized protein YtfP